MRHMLSEAQSGVQATSDKDALYGKTDCSQAPPLTLTSPEQQEQGLNSTRGKMSL